MQQAVQSAIDTAFTSNAAHGNCSDVHVPLVVPWTVLRRLRTLHFTLGQLDITDLLHMVMTGSNDGVPLFCR